MGKPMKKTPLPKSYLKKLKKIQDNLYKDFIRYKNGEYELIDCPKTTFNILFEVMENDESFIEYIENKS